MESRRRKGRTAGVGEKGRMVVRVGERLSGDIWLLMLLGEVDSWCRLDTEPRFVVGLAEHHSTDTGPLSTAR